MECLIHLLALCVFDPSQVYVTAGLESAFHDGDRTVLAQRCYGTSYCVKGRPDGPVGTIRLGAQIEFRSGLTIDYGIAHRSYAIWNRDHGTESAFVQLTWRPFR